MRILLADNSTDHQLIVRALLRETAHDLDVVDNGKLAVESFKAKRFELVLMQAAIPMLDGCTAVRAMRAWEREMGTAAIPIVMLVRRDRDNVASALIAGASAYLARPIEENTLFDCLKNLRWPDPAVTWAGRGVEDRTKRIVIKVDPALRALIPGFLDKRKADLAELKASLKIEDFEAIRLMAHRLKGKGNGYGFAGISKAGDMLEHAARARDVFGVREGIDALSNYLSRLDLVY